MFLLYLLAYLSMGLIIMLAFARTLWVHDEPKLQEKDISFLLACTFLWPLMGVILLIGVIGHSLLALTKLVQR